MVLEDNEDARRIEVTANVRKKKHNDMCGSEKIKSIAISVSREEATKVYGGCLGAKCRRRTWVTAKSLGEP